MGWGWWSSTGEVFWREAQGLLFRVRPRRGRCHLRLRRLRLRRRFAPLPPIIIVDGVAIACRLWMTSADRSCYRMPDAISSLLSLTLTRFAQPNAGSVSVIATALLTTVDTPWNLAVLNGPQVHRSIVNPPGYKQSPSRRRVPDGGCQEASGEGSRAGPGGGPGGTPGAPGGGPCRRAAEQGLPTSRGTPLENAGQEPPPLDNT